MIITSPHQRIPLFDSRTGKTIQISAIHLWKICEKLPPKTNSVILTSTQAFRIQPIDNLVNCK